MPKIGSKYKLQDIVPLQTILDTVDNIESNVLLQISRIVASQEYAVRFYNDKLQPVFYKNDERLRYAVMKAISISSFDHWEQVIDILHKNDALELTQEQYINLNEKLYGIVQEQELH
ncbi:hypothetical protein [Clostridium thermarum]|uniref:hypothetical protein n=1 Tax=Clostridium thermarum TaxID=1716543 RepID=UPI0013CF5A53|nr:hypothetical protein [Clostridium thermarum]